MSSFKGSCSKHGPLDAAAAATHPWPQMPPRPFQLRIYLTLNLFLTFPFFLFSSSLSLSHINLILHFQYNTNTAINILAKFKSKVFLLANLFFNPLKMHKSPQNDKILSFSPSSCHNIISPFQMERTSAETNILGFWQKYP